MKTNQPIAKQSDNLHTYPYLLSFLIWLLSPPAGKEGTTSLLRFTTETGGTASQSLLPSCL